MQHQTAESKISILTLSWLGYCLTVVGTQLTDQICVNRFEYEYNVIQKLTEFADKIKELEASSTAVLKETVHDLQGQLSVLQRTTDGSNYVRWGRSACPDGSEIVYQGYAGGAKYSHSGSGANVLCLHSEPTWKTVIKGDQNFDYIYGAEYYFIEHSYMKHLHRHDVPCVVCRIPRSNVLMVPGRNKCDKDFKVEYTGYLMTELYSHANNAEYICVDDSPEALDGGATGIDGKFLFFVQASCGPIKCPPYIQGHELTCAVCSFNPISNGSSVIPRVN